MRAYSTAQNTSCKNITPPENHPLNGSLRIKLIPNGYLSEVGQGGDHSRNTVDTTKVHLARPSRHPTFVSPLTSSSCNARRTEYLSFAPASNQRKPL